MEEKYFLILISLFHFVSIKQEMLDECFFGSEVRTQNCICFSHAPWCPACRDLRKAWEGFADWSEDLKVNIAEVDVTVSPGLSGRFLVTALPTIYHVKDGVFRQYLGSRDKDDFITFIEDKKYSSVPPLASWKHPDTYQMTLVSYFFKLSMFVRDMHNHLVEKQNIPPWASYAIFGCGILVLGCILGFVIVYLIDCLFPTALGDVATEKSTTDVNKSKNKKKQTKKNVKNKDKKSDNESSDSELNVAKNSQSEGETSGNDDKTRQRKKLQNGGARKE
uniref:Thioredoxin domain-containing protein n=1 Tax=Romanomermis culicivorax TaxID=13658 RepID=A0A915HTX2_ROMCU